MARPGDRQEITRDRLPDRVVTEGHGIVGFEQEAIGECLGPARPQVRIEDALALARPGHRARRRPVGVHLEGGRDRRQLFHRQRPVRQRHQAQDPTALLRADRQARDHELIEGAGQRRARQLASGREQLLRDERQAARALGHEEQQARRCPFAFDPLDERRQFVAIEWGQGQLLGPGTGQDRGEVRRPRVIAGDDVGLMAAHDREPLVARDPGQERDERAGGGVGEVEILEDEDDRVLLAKPPEQPEHPFEGPGLATFRGGRAAARGLRADLREPGPEIGQEPNDLGRGGPEQLGERRGRQVEQGRPDGAHDRAVGLVRPRRPRRRPQDGHRIAQGPHPLEGLVEEPGDPDAGRALDQERPGPTMGGVLQHGGQPREPRFAPHEPLARVPGGHSGILGPCAVADPARGAGAGSIGLG